MYKKKNNFHLIAPGKLLIVIGAVVLAFFLILPSSRQFLINWVDDTPVIDESNIPYAELDKIKNEDPKLYHQIKGGIIKNYIYNGSTNEITVRALEAYDKYDKGFQNTQVISTALWSEGKPNEALSILLKYEEDTGFTNEDFSDEYLLHKVEVCQGNNRTPEAFEAYKVYFNRQEQISKDHLGTLIKLARAGNRMNEVIELTKNDTLNKKLQDSASLNDADIYELMGDVALAGGENEAAIDHYKKSLELDDSRIYINAQIGKAYEWSNEPELAFQFYLKSLGHDDEYAIDRLLDLAEGLGLADQLANVLSEHPEKIMEMDKGLFLARLFLENGDNQSSYEWYEKLCWKEDVQSSIYLEYISILMAAQEYEKAVEFAVGGQKKFSSVLEFRELVGDILLNLLQYERAFEQYYQLVSANYNHSSLKKTIDLGVALGKDDEITTLLTDYRNNNAISEAYLYEQLAMSYFRDGNFKGFQDIILEGYSKFPNDVYLLEKLFLSHQKLGNVGETMTMIETYPDQLLSNPYIMDYYLDHLLNNENVERAEYILDTYPKDGTFSGDLVDNTLKQRYRARIAVLQKDYDTALMIYRELDESDSLQDFHLVPYLALLVDRKDFLTANRLIKKMAALDHEDYYVNAARAYIYQGEQTKAMRYVNRVTSDKKLAFLWTDIGNYHEENGNKHLAREAYLKAYGYLEKELNLN